MKYLSKTLCSVLALTALSGCVTDGGPLETLAEIKPQGLTIYEASQSHALDLSMPLSPNNLATIAVYTNPDLIALRSRENVALAQVFAAGLYPDPNLSFGFDAPLNGVGLVPALASGLGFDFAAIARRPAVIRAEQANLDSIRMDIAWAEWLVGEQVKLAATRSAYARDIYSKTRIYRALTDNELVQTLKAVTRGDLPASALEARRLSVFI